MPGNDLGLFAELELTNGRRVKGDMVLAAAQVGPGRSVRGHFTAAGMVKESVQYSRNRLEPSADAALARNDGNCLVLEVPHRRLQANAEEGLFLMSVVPKTDKGKVVLVILNFDSELDLVILC